MCVHYTSVHYKLRAATVRNARGVEEKGEALVTSPVAGLHADNSSGGKRTLILNEKSIKRALKGAIGRVCLLSIQDFYAIGIMQIGIVFLRV